MHYTLIYPVRRVGTHNEVLLGYMLSGTWTGYFNGFGGKIGMLETPVAAAIRELHEEAGILVELSQITYRGNVVFIEPDGDPREILVDVFTTIVDRHTIPKNTDDAIPCWFHSEHLPMRVMPPFDKYFINMIGMYRISDAPYLSSAD